MNKELGLMKSHISALQQILSKYVYNGKFPNTQSENVREIRRAIADLEWALNKTIGQDKE